LTFECNLNILILDGAWDVFGITSPMKENPEKEMEDEQ